MNLKEFINYRTNCPVCKSQLVTYFQSKRRQTLRYEENRVVFLFDLNASLGQGKQYRSYDVGYSFDLEDDLFYIEFYDMGNFSLDLCEEVNFGLMGRFKELHKNLKVFRFLRDCRNCQHYSYQSQTFPIHLSGTRLDPLFVCEEEIGLTYPVEDGLFRIYYLLNAYDENNSYLNIIKGTEKWGGRLIGGGHGSGIKLPIIPITSPEEMIQRFNNLLAFL